jgi:aquaglyceroporin related protein
MDNFDKQKHLPSQGPVIRPQDSSSLSQPASDEVTFAHREHDGHFQKDRDSADGYPYHAEHGPPIDNALKYDEAEEDYQHHKNLWWSRVRHHLRDPFAEFMGTFIMILFGDGSVAQVMLSANPNLPKASQNKGDYQSISWG